jgi:hypothetical protein
MKINKNVVLEYLYLTIFVITLFVLKELIEYVFFTRKRNNVIERFFDNSPVCSRIAHYHDSYEHLKNLLDNFNIQQDDGSCAPRIKVRDYVEIKNLDPGNNAFTRIILKPDIPGIFFEKITAAAAEQQNGESVSEFRISKAVSIKVFNNQLEFSKYDYNGDINRIFDTTNKFDFIDFSTRHMKNEKVFAVFDINTDYHDISLNKSLKELIDKHIDDIDE